MTKQIRIKWLAPALAVATFLFLLLIMQVTVHAAPAHGFGRNEGRIAPVNVNDHHTSQWDRFSFNYQFTSGSDHRFELGRPTGFDGFVPVDVFSVNMRRDANVSFRPPSYGVFSGIIPTTQSNQLFPAPTNPHFHQPIHLSSPNLIPAFDTLQQGVNAEPIGNPMNFQQNVSTGEFLPSTSIGTAPSN